MSEKDTILEVKNLKTFFHTGKKIAHAVDGISFNIKAGETLAIVGESGSGKSVSSLSILQLLARPAGFIAGGEILFEGDDLVRMKMSDLRHIRGNRVSMIFQEPMTALNPVFTVGFQLAEVIQLHQKLTGEALHQRCVEMLDKVGIPSPEARLEDYPHQLSGGMRQRVMIAIALACRPKLLIADEPTTALDVTVQSQIMNLITELREELGTAVLLITHNMGLVQENADEVCVMYAGKIVEHASKKDLFANPKHPYTQLLLKSLPTQKLRGMRLATIDGMVPRATDFPTGCRFANRCPFAKEACTENTPKAYNVGENRTVSCLKFDDNFKQLWENDDSSAEKLLPAPPSVFDPTHKILDVNQLKTWFPIRRGFFKSVVGHVKAVDGVDLDLYRGETLAIVGESGCGKTTVGKTLIHLVPPTGGTAQFDGKVDLVQLSRSKMRPYRSQIQMIFQDPFSSLNPRLMVGEIIMEGMETHHIGKDREERYQLAAQMMKRVGLDPQMMNRYPHQFSGGQRQRIGLARALAVRPELIICDESTSALDISVQAQILNLLKELQSEFNLSYIFITHDLSVVEYISDRIAVMYLGRIVETGTTDEIFNSPKHPYTRALLSAAPQIDPDSGVVKIKLDGDVPSPINPPTGCYFHPRCEFATTQCKTDYPQKQSFTSTHCTYCHHPLNTNSK